MNTRSIGTALVAAALFALPVAGSQQSSATEILDRCIEALGGRAAWDRVETMELRGTFSTFSTEAHPFLIQRKRPNLYRFDHREANIPITVAFDGTTAWWANPVIPFSAVPWPTAPPVFYTRGFEADAEFGYPFLDTAKRGHRVELAGRVDFEGIDAYQLELELANGGAETWYVDATTFLPAARRATAGYVGREAESLSFYSDYRDVGGVLVPHAIESELGNRFGVMVVEAVELNVAIDDAAFEMPIPPAMARLRGLAGSWRVEVSTRQAPTLPWIVSQATSRIVPLFGGRVLEEEISYLSSHRPRNLKRLYAYDRFREVLRVVHVDDLTAHANVFEGRGREDRIAVDNLKTGTQWSVMDQTFHQRQVIYDLGADAFSVDLDVSIDGGETWSTLERFRYVRNTTD